MTKKLRLQHFFDIIIQSLQNLERGKFKLCNTTTKKSKMRNNFCSLLHMHKHTYEKDCLINLLLFGPRKLTNRHYCTKVARTFGFVSF